MLNQGRREEAPGTGGNAAAHSHTGALRRESHEAIYFLPLFGLLDRDVVAQAEELQLQLQGGELVRNLRKHNQLLLQKVQQLESTGVLISTECRWMMNICLQGCDADSVCRAAQPKATSTSFGVSSNVPAVLNIGATLEVVRMQGPVDKDPSVTVL